MPKILRFLKRKIDSFLFWLRNPASLKVEVLNPSSIHLGRGARVGLFGRIFVNDPASGSSIALGDRVWLGRNVELQVWSGQKLNIHHRATIQDLCKVLGDVTIGAYSTLASNVFISSGTHQYAAKPTRLVKEQDVLFPDVSLPTRIEEDVWIGNNVFVKNGVTIGRGAVIGANSIVNKNIEPYSVCAGSPAQKIKSRLEFAPPNTIEFGNENHRPYFYSGFDHETIHAEGFKLISNTGVLALSPKSANLLSLKIQSTYNQSINLEVATEAKRTVFEIKPGVQIITVGPLSEKPNSSFQKVEIIPQSRASGAIYVNSATLT